VETRKAADTTRLAAAISGSEAAGKRPNRHRRFLP